MNLLDKIKELIISLKYRTMLLYCLKCKKIQKTSIQVFQKLVIAKQCYYQNVLDIVVKNQDLLKM